jgi:hypothetical protein
MLFREAELWHQNGGKVPITRLLIGYICFDAHISGKTGLKKDDINLTVMPRQDARSQLLGREN